jgi:multiple sugar transport system ATP-binding protein
MAGIGIEGVSKVYGDGTLAVDDLDLEIGDGEFVVLVGPSGCGKTTALRMVAGLEEITEGTVRVGERVVNDLPPKDRDIAMVFQNYALYPHMSAYDNMGFGLKMRGMPRSEIDRRVKDAAKVLGLDEVLRKKPRTLSGGQRQRVAMGRAIVREPQAFLMDEPLSNLDAKLRVEMRAEITRIQRDLGVTTMYVTHDQTEAMTLGDRVAVMSKGVLQQLASPQELYDRPVNLFVAEFIGSPAMNIAEGTLNRSDGDVVVRFGDAQELVVPPPVLETRPALTSYVDRKVVFGVRPEDIEDAEFVDGPVDGRSVTATLDIREDMGSEVFAHFAMNAPPPALEAVEEALGHEAAAAETEAARRGARRFIARLDRATRAHEGEPVRLAVDTRRLHFFDESTGRAIYD